MRENRSERGRQDRVARRLLRGGALLLLSAALLAGCATGRAIRAGDSAATQGDWDTAVTYYRQAIGRDPSRVDLKIKLDRAMRMAAADHVKRARELEADNQLPGAAAEYRMAADLDPASTTAMAKATELERKIRDQVEASRPPARVDTLRQQAAEASPIPHLDPRTVVPEIKFSNAAVRDILGTISDLTGINITYDQGLDAALSRPYSIDIQATPLEDVLNQIMQANALTYKVVNRTTIFAYQDNVANRQKYEDQYLQTFYLSNADPTELQTALQQLLAGTQIPVRPVFAPNKTANTLTVKATAPVMKVIESYIRSNDRPQPEVLIEAEILEVDRSYIRQLGIDLNQWALGFTFSPEVSPGGASGAVPPTAPPPINLNTISHGVSANDFYLSSPTALVNLLESNNNTRLLARPEMRGRAGQQISLKLGDQIPIPTTVFQSAAAGGIANVPTTSVTYQSVGVNLIFTPRVTYQDEIVLDQLTLEKSGLGSNIDVGGSSFPTIVSRRADASLRLRDGESTLIAGLFRDEDRRTIKSLPGLTTLPVLRSLFGNSNRSIDQTDIVMVITPHIVRSHEITADDLKPVYIGTGQNIGAGGVPSLISPEAIGAVSPEPATAPGITGAAPPIPVSPGPAPAPSPQMPAPRAAPGASNIVPILPAGQTPTAAPAAPAAARVVITPPPAGPSGALQAGGGPFTMPIQISGVSNLATISLTMTFDPAIISTPTVTEGSFMMQGGVTPTFAPGVDARAGRIDVAVSRPLSQRGADGAGLLAAITFTAGNPGTTDVSLTGVATTPDGQSVPLQFAPVHVTVR